jgi:carbamoyl-phosphate synthase/aspartate carbamoyltransferase
LKALRASRFDVNKKGNIIISIGSNEYREEFRESYETLKKNYDNIYFTPGTGKFYGVSDEYILTYEEVKDMLKRKEVGLFIIVSKRGSFNNVKTNGWSLRRAGINTNTPVMTNIKCIKMYIKALIENNEESLKVKDVDYLPSLNNNKEDELNFC